MLCSVVSSAYSESGPRESTRILMKDRRAWHPFSLRQCLSTALAGSSMLRCYDATKLYIWITCQHAYMPTCQHAYMPTCLHADMPTCRHAFMLSCRHAVMPSCRHAVMPTYQHAWTEHVWSCPDWTGLILSRFPKFVTKKKGPWSCLILSRFANSWRRRFR